jgi:acyl-coenzyme A thioesterase PaaI-like protein
VIDTQDGAIELNEGESTVIRRGIQHKPRAEERAVILMLEPKRVKSKGDEPLIEAQPPDQSVFQNFYPDDYAQCYGCGRLNEHGHQIKTVWKGDQSVTRFTPQPYHIALPGFVYGGLIASLFDCHCTGTATAAMYRRQGRELGSEPVPRFVTASLKVDYLKPTPLGVELEIRGTVKEITDRKVVVAATLSANGVVCAQCEAVAVRMPESMQSTLPSQS